MGLVFADATTDNVNCTSDADTDDIQEGTLCVQYTPVSVGNSAKVIVGKCNATVTDGWAFFKTAADGTKLTFLWNRATADMVQTTVAGVAAAGVPLCVTVTWSISGDTAAIWASSAGGGRMTEVGTIIEAAGSGAIVSDAANDFMIGNADAGASLAAPANIDNVAFFGAVLTQAQFESWHGCPRLVVDGITAKKFIRCGSPSNQAGTQIDEGGNGDGVVTGATVGAGFPRGFVARTGGMGRAGYRHSLLVS